MVARVKIVLDIAGVGEVLKSDEVRAEIVALAEEVAIAATDAEPVQDHDVPVLVTDFTTDRAIADVTLHHPAGVGIEAKYGVLAAAAGAAGLEVKQLTRKGKLRKR